MNEPVGRAEVRLVAAGGAAVGLAVVAALVRALTGGWYPVGDNAYFAIRSMDVLTEHHPLLGTWTSASHSLGFDVNNPGPLLFDVLAVPAWIDPTLLPIGVALLVAVSVVAMVGCARSVAGARGAAVAVFASAALAWTMGPELLVDPWQPHALLFPFLTALVATIAVWSGSNGSLVVLAATGSLLVQTHLTFGPTVAVLGGSACVAVGRRWWRLADERSRIGRVVAVTGLVCAVLWAQPLYEQVTADERGNLSRLAEASTAERTESIGVGMGVEIAGTLLQPLPAWAPPSFEDDFQQDVDEALTPPAFESGPSRTLAAGALGATITVLGVLGAWAWRRRAIALASAAVVTILAVAATTVTVITLPLQVYGLAAHHVRFLWPVSVLITATLVAGLVRWRTGFRVVAGASIALALLALVPRDATVGPEVDDYAAPVMRALAPQLEVLRNTDSLVYDPDSSRVFGPYSTPVMLELERRGVDVRVEQSEVRQLGPSRAADGSEAGRFFVWQGDLAVDGRDGLERVALVQGLDIAERAELADLTDAVRDWFREGGVELTTDGRRAVVTGRLPDVEAILADAEDPLAAMGVGTALLAFERDQLAVPAHASDLDRWVDLQTRQSRETVGVWVEWREGAGRSR